MNLILAFLVWFFQPYTLTDLDFIVGHWQGGGEAVVIEEVWSRPSGDNMMGMFRYVQEDKGVFYEMMLIEQTAEGPVLRIKHFNAGLIGWEEKEEVHSFPLIHVDETEAVFEQTDQTKKLRYIIENPGQLDVYLEELQEDGTWKINHFSYAKQKSE